ncbi:MAG: L,D-transpeptidase [Rhizobiaceae bacterium]|nr:L,D-transpeptidase [Rhizobiaceae bacterium]MCV0408803.1 L,D-transpeptidase [Rhizobiaceae bacterium]
MSRNLVWAAVAAIALLLADMTSAVAATLVARVDVAAQTMTVSQHGRVIYRWPVSTARRGFITPRGTWRPKRLHRMWYSRKYDMSPMPYSVFYHGGYAIHGTNYIRSLGRPASHGCVRLHTANAKRFYQLVRKHGMGNTRVVVVN